jgi:transcriptional regulator MftR-like protein
VAVAAYEHWLDDATADLGALLDDGMRQLGAAFDGSLGSGALSRSR